MFELSSCYIILYHHCKLFYYCHIIIVILFLLVSFNNQKFSFSSESPPWSLSSQRTVKTLTRLPVKCCWSFFERRLFSRKQFDMFDNVDISSAGGAVRRFVFLSAAFQIKSPRSGHSLSSLEFLAFSQPANQGVEEEVEGSKPHDCHQSVFEQISNKSSQQLLIPAAESVTPGAAARYLAAASHWRGDTHTHTHPEAAACSPPLPILLSLLFQLSCCHTLLHYLAAVQAGPGNTHTHTHTMCVLQLLWDIAACTAVCTLGTD